MNALTQLINTISRYLQQEKIPHALVGGVAVAIWGRPRATEDVDIIVDLKEEQVEAFQAYLQEHGVRLNADKARRAIQQGVPFPLYDRWSIHWADARPAVRPIDRHTLERAVFVELAEEKVPIATAEDTVLGKLLAGSSQDHLDAKSILLRRAETIDLPYLENRVRELGLHEAWTHVRPEDPPHVDPRT